ncbi:MAG TPA: hypothetical protein VG937_03425 [Polyangiaceae bacterium]|nr:hypothetical protein [Polyangiaceae bacterium]
MSRPEVLRAPHARLLSAFALLAMVLRTPRVIWGDTWFNLVLGREIAQGGLIQQNLLTEQGFGERCVDLQWLAHAILYGVERAVGMPGVALLASALTCVSFLAAAEFALTRRSATPVRTLLVGLLALLPLTSLTVARAQTLSLPLLAGFVWVLSEHARSPSRAVWWLVPGAALWGNLHGSALLAPALTGVALVSRVYDGFRAQRGLDFRQLARDVVLTLCVALALFVSPYGGKLFGYYASTFGNAEFRVYLSEWQRPSLGESPEVVLLIAWVLLLLAVGVRRLSTFELLTTLALVLLAATSVRHAAPLALVAVAFLPPAADRALGKHLLFELDRVLEFMARWLPRVALVLFAFGIPLGTAYVQRRDFPVSFSDQVARAAGGSLHLLVDEAHADRLLWFHPELKGRIAHDARAETMPLSFLKALARAYAEPRASDAREWLAGYDIVVVGRASHPVLRQALNDDPSWQLFAEDPATSAFRPVRARR